MPQQIPLDLSPEPVFSFETFQVGDSNSDAAAMVRAWPQWPSPILLLAGPQGSGKTHLGTAWARANSGHVFKSEDVTNAAKFNAGSVFIDQATDVLEDTLFTLMNMALNGKIEGLLMTARTLPENWDIVIPDLRSRLVNTPVAILGEHEDDVLEAIIRKLFEDMGRSVKADVTAYLMKNCDRSVNAMRTVIGELEHSARQSKRDMTRAFVAAQLKP